MSDLNTTVINIFNNWFLKQHGLLPEQAIQRSAELEASIERIRELPLLLTDDEESCMVMRRMIEDAIEGNNHELQEDS